MPKRDIAHEQTVRRYMEMSEKPYTTSARCGIMHLDDRSIAAIESVLAKGHRAEVIPTKDGVRVVHVKREAVKDVRNVQTVD